MPITREIRSAERLCDPARHDLDHLTAAEKLFLWRHRQRTLSGRLLGRNGAAMNQAEAAEKLGLDRALYSRLENGQRTRLSAEDAESLIEALGPMTLSLGERCFLARRRSGRLLGDIEREIGVSRPWFHEMERAGHPTIVQYWTARGFLFPAHAPEMA